MKKLILPLLAVGVLFSSCKKDDPIEYGTMSIMPKEAQEVHYNNSVTFTPTLSKTGEVLKAQFDWSVSDPNVLKLNVTTIGNKGEVTGNRIGSAYVRYISKGDGGRYKDSVKVTVKPRQNFRKIFFKKGAKIDDVIADEGKLAADSVSGNYYFFNRETSSTQIFNKVIYQIDATGLIATYAVLESNATNASIIGQYIDERFRNLGDNVGKVSKRNITFFDASAAPVRMYDPGVIIGGFENNPNLISNETLPLGIVIADEVRFN